MSLITAEHRLRSSTHDSCWVTLTKGEKWFLASIEFRSGRLMNSIPGGPYETEAEALNAAKSFVNSQTGLNFE